MAAALAAAALRGVDAAVRQATQDWDIHTRPAARPAPRSVAGLPPCQRAKGSQGPERQAATGGVTAPASRDRNRASERLAAPRCSSSCAVPPPSRDRALHFAVPCWGAALGSHSKVYMAAFHVGTNDVSPPAKRQARPIRAQGCHAPRAPRARIGQRSARVASSRVAAVGGSRSTCFACSALRPLRPRRARPGHQGREHVPPPPGPGRPISTAIHTTTARRHCISANRRAAVANF